MSNQQSVGQASSSLKPSVTQPRSRGRSVTTSDKPSYPILGSPSQVSAPSPHLSAATSTASGASSPSLRSRAPTLSLVPVPEDSKVLQPVDQEEPDTPIKTHSTNLQFTNNSSRPIISLARANTYHTSSRPIKARDSNAYLTSALPLSPSDLLQFPASTHNRNAAADPPASVRLPSEPSPVYTARGGPLMSANAVPVGVAAVVGGLFIAGGEGAYRAFERAQDYFASGPGGGNGTAIDWSTASGPRYNGKRRGSDEDFEQGLLENQQEDGLYDGESEVTRSSSSEDFSELSVETDTSSDFTGRSTPGSSLHSAISSSYPPRPTLPKRPSSNAVLTKPSQSSAVSKKPTFFLQTPDFTYSSLATQQQQGLPTPALSSASLSGFSLPPRNGTLNQINNFTSSSSTSTPSEVWYIVRDMLPILGVTVLSFIISAGFVLWGLSTLPIPPALVKIPKSASDINGLSKAMSSYMAASWTGYWHTVLVLAFTGIWKHTFSVPGSVVLNILVGALLPTVPAVIFLTTITTLGGVGAYELSRPLSPLVKFAFPKPLAVVKSALTSPTSTSTTTASTSSSTTASVWRRLLIMRATGLVPWSGMNVACGVVGVDLVLFSSTYAAGSLSWNYVTSQVGALLIHISTKAAGSAQPSSILNPNMSTSALNDDGSASLTSLLRDPTLVTKLVLLSVISLIPLLLKPKQSNTSSPTEGIVSNWNRMVGKAQRTLTWAFEQVGLGRFIAAISQAEGSGNSLAVAPGGIELSEGVRR